MQFIRGAVKSNQKLDCKIDRPIFHIMLFYKSGMVADLEFHNGAIQQWWNLQFKQITCAVTGTLCQRATGCVLL